MYRVFKGSEAEKGVSGRRMTDLMAVPRVRDEGDWVMRPREQLRNVWNRITIYIRTKNNDRKKIWFG